MMEDNNYDNALDYHYDDENDKYIVTSIAVNRKDELPEGQYTGSVGVSWQAEDVMPKYLK